MYRALDIDTKVYRFYTFLEISNAWVEKINTQHGTTRGVGCTDRDHVDMMEPFHMSYTSPVNEPGIGTRSGVHSGTS